MWRKQTTREQVADIHYRCAQLRIELANLEKKLNEIQSLCPHPGNSIIMLTAVNELMDCRACDECGKVLE